MFNIALDTLDSSRLGPTPAVLTSRLSFAPFFGFSPLLLLLLLEEDEPCG